MHILTQTLTHVHMFRTSTAANKDFALTSTHTLSCTLSLSRSVWHNHTLFHFKKSWLQGHRHVFLYITCCLTLSVSIHPSPPGELDYMSALVRPGNAVTPVISFIDCPSIRPPTHPSVRLHHHPFPWASIRPSLHADTKCGITAAYLHISHLALSMFCSFYFYYSTSLFIVTLSPPWLIFSH